MKIRHILGKKEFVEILNGGKRTRGEKTTVYTGGTSEEEAVGLIVPKKMVDSAVTRNYLRRSIYAYFRDLPESEGAKKRTVIRIISPIDKTNKKKAGLEIKKEIEKARQKA
ncbi:MAG: ribonuclease P protein component [Candidatus Omnitrophota bacterium]